MAPYYFASRNFNVIVPLKPSLKSVLGGEIVKTPGIRATFKNGILVTEDEEMVKLLRAHAAKDPTVVEITADDINAFRPKKAKNKRGPQTADEKKSLAPQLAEISNAPAKCPLCDKEFKNKRAMELHLVSHRAAVQSTVKASLTEKQAE